jgi:hypothetical protein
VRAPGKPLGFLPRQKETYGSTVGNRSEPKGKPFVKIFKHSFRVARQVVLFTVICLLPSLGISSQTHAADVEFIVGDLMVSEGGTWDPKSSPLTSPFGVDFNS